MLLRHRKPLLAVSDACDAYRLLMALGSDLRDIDGLLNAAYALPWHAMLQPKPLAALRRAHAEELVAERGQRLAEEVRPDHRTTPSATPPPRAHKAAGSPLDGPRRLCAPSASPSLSRAALRSDRPAAQPLSAVRQASAAIAVVEASS
eukprot:6311783-Prymnesium_polylepis.1